MPRESFRLRRISLQLSDPRHQSRERQRPVPEHCPGRKRPCETKPNSGKVISSRLPVVSDLPPIPPGPAGRHEPAVGPRRVPTGATTSAKRTQAPRQPESPHSWPPPSCLRASVPSCLFLPNEANRTPAATPRLAGKPSSLCPGACPPKAGAFMPPSVPNKPTDPPAIRANLGNLRNTLRNEPNAGPDATSPATPHRHVPGNPSCLRAFPPPLTFPPANLE